MHSEPIVALRPRVHSITWASHHDIGANLKRARSLVNGYVLIQMLAGYHSFPECHFEEVTEVT